MIFLIGYADTISFKVAWPRGDAAEAVIVKVDCAGEVSFDGDGIDLVMATFGHARGIAARTRGRVVTTVTVSADFKLIEVLDCATITSRILTSPSEDMTSATTRVRRRSASRVERRGVSLRHHHGVLLGGDRLSAGRRSVVAARSAAFALDEFAVDLAAEGTAREGVITRVNRRTMHAMDPHEVIAVFKGAGALLRRLRSLGVFTRYTAAADADGKRLLAEGVREATVIKAEGDAQVAMIRANAKNEIAERGQQSKHRMERIQALHELGMADEVAQRAIYRGERELLFQQENLEAIVEGALPELTDGAAPERVDDDWLANLLGRCCIISDKQMQSLWSRVLAGEVNMPGSFSRRTVNAVADLDK